MDEGKGHNVLEFLNPRGDLLDWTSQSPPILGAKKATLDILLNIEEGLDVFSPRERQRLSREREEIVTRIGSYGIQELEQFRNAYAQWTATLKAIPPKYDATK